MSENCNDSSPYVLRQKCMTVAMFLAQGDMEASFGAIIIAYEAKMPFMSLERLTADVDPKGNSCLHYALRDIGLVDEAIIARKAAIARFLIKSGADPLLANDDGERPIDFIPETIAIDMGLPYARRGKMCIGNSDFGKFVIK